MNIRIFSLDRKYFKAFCYLLIFSLVYVLPIIWANFYYIDDLGRLLTGRTGWDGDGRPMVSLLSIILSDGKPLMDMSPWIQILATIVLDYALLFFAKKIIPAASALKLFGVAACGYLNLFMLENLSYKYDSLGMMLALSLFLILFALPESLGNKKIFLASCIAVLLSLCLYQAALGSYISLAIVECVWLLYIKVKGNVIIQRILLRAFSMLLGGLLYRFSIVPYYMSDNGYASAHVSLLNPLSGQGLQTWYAHISAFFSLYVDYGVTIGVMGILLLLVLYGALGHISWVVWTGRGTSIPIKLVSVIFILTVPFLLLGATIFTLTLLKEPVIAPRVMISFTVFSLFMGLMLYHVSEIKKGFYFLLVASLACTLSFSSYYGNLLKQQDKINTQVATYLVYDINQIETQEGKKFNEVAFIGTSPESQALILAKKKRPLFSRLIPIYMNNNWYWGGQYLSCFRTSTVKLKSGGADAATIQALTSVRSNEFYKLYEKDNSLIIQYLSE